MRLILPQAETIRAYGGPPLFAALIDISNFGTTPLRLEVRLSSMDEWQLLIPSLPPGSSWAAAAGRRTPLWLPRMALLRLVEASDGTEVMLRAVWGDGGRLVYAP